MNYNLHYEIFHNISFESKKKDIEWFKNIIETHKLIPQKKTNVLELGCSMGRLMLALKEFKITNIKGVDIDPKFVNIAQKEGLNVIQSDILDFLRNSDEKFDAIYCFDVIEHIEKEYQEELFVELNKHLNENGFVAIKTINALSPTSGYFRYIDLTHELSYTPTTLEFLGKLGNFNEIIVRPEYEESEEGKRLKNTFAEIYYQQFGMKDVILTPNLVAVLFKSKDAAEQYKLTAPKINNNYLAYNYQNYEIRPLKTLIQYYISKLFYKLTFGKVDCFNLKDVKYKFVVLKTKK